MSKTNEVKLMCKTFLIRVRASLVVMLHNGKSIQTLTLSIFDSMIVQRGSSLMHIVLFSYPTWLLLSCKSPATPASLAGLWFRKVLAFVG